MKLEDILSEAFNTTQGAGNSIAASATGGFIKPSYINPMHRKYDSWQIDAKIDFLKKVKDAGEDGYSQEMEYDLQNEVDSLVMNGILDKHEGKYFITQFGYKWLDRFTNKQGNFSVKSWVPSFGSGPGWLGGTT